MNYLQKKLQTARLQRRRKKSAPLWSRASRSSKEAESKMDKQEQTDQDRCRGHVLFAKACSVCPLPVWPVITERLGLSADCRWPCVDPDNLQSNHMMAALAPRATGNSTVNPQNNRTFKISSSQHRSRDRRRLQDSLIDGW